MNPGTSVSAPNGVDFAANGVIASSLHLNGGTLTTPFIYGNDYGGATHVILNGTTVVASASSGDFLQVHLNGNSDPHSAAARIDTGGAIFDTNGYDITVAVPLHDHVAPGGTLTKQGAGTLTLTANNAWAAGTTISAGTLQVGNGGNTGSLGTGPVANSGTLVWNNTSGVAISGANAITGPGALTIKAGIMNVLYHAGGSVSNGTITVDGTGSGNSSSFMLWAPDGVPDPEQ